MKKVKKEKVKKGKRKQIKGKEKQNSLQTVVMEVRLVLADVLVVSVYMQYEHYKVFRVKNTF